MNDTFPAPASSITIFRELISELDPHQLSDIQKIDLCAVAEETIEGLCHGLMFISEAFANGNQYPNDSLEQVGAFLSAAAHLFPALRVLSEYSPIAH
ncbi:hypothetical protein VU677_16095 [Hafnia paralvei]|uniref:hypothetical protein n=1 Tax=Hafnia paralvei TaxID=546367 RepID=UPI00300D1865